MAQARQIQAKLNSRQFADGHQFLFLGQKYPIQIHDEASIKRVRIEFDGESWQVKMPQHFDEVQREVKLREKMVQWFRSQAEEILGGRIFHYSRIMDIAPDKIAIRTQKRMWGCCDYNTKTIHLNWQIIFAPPRVVDYVVVHEMCHLFVPNHSKRFWKKVGKFMPDYDEARQWLKKHHYDLILP